MTLLPIPFDNPDTYPGHTGVDFGQSRGTPFRASGPGVVTVRGYSPRAGYTIWVRYDVGCEVGYVHMDSHRDCPAPGTRLVEGSFLGYVGNTGLYSTGPHLHAEVEGYSSTDGFWQWFTPDRVVGQGVPSKDSDITPDEEEDEDMCKNSGIWWTAANGKQMNAVVNTCSGYFDDFESSNGKYNSDIALAFGTGSFAEVSAGQAKNIENRCAAVRQGK